MAHLYKGAGVDGEAKGQALAGLVGRLAGTFGNHPRARVGAGIGHYATVIDLESPRISIAVSTDGVGTKVLVAQLAGRHDTVGIDCVAMNANDVACVGADPLTLVDYVAVDRIDAAVLDQIGEGLAEGARRAGISIAGGELAQVRDLIKGAGDGCHYDLVGTCVGVLEPRDLIDGSTVEPGDVVVGIASSGLHSNGYSLARKAFLDIQGRRLDEHVPELGRTLAEELLEPTAMYVRECRELKRRSVPVKALFHVTGGGFTNLLRIAASGVGFCLDTLPDPPPVMKLIQAAAKVGHAEMHEVFNMGVGFAVVVPKDHVQAVVDVAASEGKAAWPIGRAVADKEQRVVALRTTFTGCLVAVKAKGGFLPSPTVPREHWQ